MDEHETIVANAVAREAVPGKSRIHSCGNNIFTGVCTNVELYSLKIGNNINSYVNAVNYAKGNGIRILVCSVLWQSGNINYRNELFESTVDGYDGIIVSSASNISNNLYECANIDEAAKIAYPTNCSSDNVIVVGNCEYENGIMRREGDSCYGKSENNSSRHAPGYI